MTDYNLTRTLITGATGGVAQGTIGAGMSAWSAKGKAGKFYDKGDGFKSDFDRDFAWAGSKADETFSGKDGKVKKFKPENPSKKNPKRKVINKTIITTPLGPNGKPFNAPSISSSPPKPLKTKANIVAPTKSAKM